MWESTTGGRKTSDKIHTYTYSVFITSPHYLTLNPTLILSTSTGNSKIPHPFLLEIDRSFLKTSTPHPQPQPQSHTQQPTSSKTLTITITIIVIISTPITYHDAAFLFFSFSSSSATSHFPVPISLHTGCAHRQVLETTKFFQA